MTIERAGGAEIEKLGPLLHAMAEHHNAVSTHFCGIYPIQPIDSAIAMMTRKVEQGVAIVEVVKVDGDIAAFCFSTAENGAGKLEDLVVAEAFRNKGYGTLLLDRAMEYFKARGVKRIDIEVVVDNQGAERLYQRYGFRPQRKILSLVCD